MNADDVLRKWDEDAVTWLAEFRPSCGVSDTNARRLRAVIAALRKYQTAKGAYCSKDVNIIAHDAERVIEEAERADG